jgi:hypothetical protein
MNFSGEAPERSNGHYAYQHRSVVRIWGYLVADSKRKPPEWVTPRSLVGPPRRGGRETALSAKAPYLTEACYRRGGTRALGKEKKLVASYCVIDLPSDAVYQVAVSHQALK